MEKRIKELRKALGLTQQRFADRLGIKQNTVAQYEIGRNDPVDTVINLMVKEFGVSESWLRTGDGEMFLQASTVTLDEYARSKGLSDVEVKVLKAYMELSPGTRRELMEHLKSMFVQEDEIDQEVESYRRELEDEKRDVETLSASHGIEEA